MLPSRSHEANPTELFQAVVLQNIAQHEGLLRYEYRDMFVDVSKSI